MARGAIATALPGCPLRIGELSPGRDHQTPADGLRNAIFSDLLLFFSAIIDKRATENRKGEESDWQPPSPNALSVGRRPRDYLGVRQWRKPKP
jgi:hypothetical protein